jgi:ubiquinone/menaquinone biosynthesis C-methylase UbiE
MSASGDLPGTNQVANPSVEAEPTKRFSSRVAYYSKYRPRYPEAILNFMEQELGFTTASVTADVGSGTGILSEMFLRHGNLVFGVEPNQMMRGAAEANLTRCPRFRSVNGSAEETTLKAKSVDFITAAQAFHWFDTIKARAEFSRILRNNGWVVLIWNTRRNSTPLMQAYERLVDHYATASGRVRHEDIDEQSIEHFLGKCKKKTFENTQLLDFEGLVGRLLSSSYSPLVGDSSYDPMLDELRRIFNSYQKAGLVCLEYDTEVHCGQLTD